MAEQFPNIVPSARKFTMGDYPSVTYRSLSGTIFKRSFGNKQTGYKLDLEFKNIGDESNLKNDSGTLLLLMRHYNSVEGTLQFFKLPRRVFSGIFKLDTSRDSGSEVARKDGLVKEIVPRDGDDISQAKAVLNASKEVILSASSINSPKLLMLSGIGPAKHLKENGIEVVADRPGVGQNLQDHLELYIQMAANEPVSLYKYWNLLGKAYVGLRWMISKTGPGASNQFESAAFIRTKAGVKYPDIQYHFLPIAVRYDGKAAVNGHGFQAHVGPMRSPSRGSVSLRSNDPYDHPAILFNYMSTEKDWDDFRRCIRLTREIFEQPSIKKFIKYEIQPGDSLQTDDELDEFISQNVESAYHPCGTCKMGDISDPMAVVDKFTKVIGIEKLRVVDSSIFPQITNGNLNGPTIMVSEKASDHILGKDPMPRANENVWVHPNWKDQQR